MIWDLHCHLNGVNGRTPEERMAQLLKYADRMGIDRLIIFLGMSFSRSYDPKPDDFRQQNDEVIQAISHWIDRALGFAYLNPNYLQESLDEIDRCLKNGPLVGIKLWVAAKCDDKAVDTIIERVAELKGVIFQHTWYKVSGNLDGESTPDELAHLAKRHPDIPLICGHTGGDWERGIRAIRDCPNVSIGTGGFDPTAGITEMAVRELGADRIIYGSDIGGRSISSQLAKITGAQIPKESQQQILGANLKKMLLPILREKGIKP
jgi:predicted TIM-barrel fold metal-dependent hydrolase